MSLKESKESSEEEINFGKEKVERNFDYLSKLKSEKKNNYSDINFEPKSGIPGIFIAFEKISDYILIQYNLEKCDGDMKGLKYIKENEEKLKIFIDYIEKETLIKKIFEKKIIHY